MADRTLVVKILGDDDSLKRTFTSSTRAVKKFDRDVTLATSRTDKLNQSARGALSGFGSKSSLLFGSGTFISTAALTAALQKSVSAASDLNEQIDKSRVVFGDSSRVIEDWAKTTARSIGITQREAIGFAGSLGNMFTAMGLGQKDAAQMSQRLVQLAADMASFNNEDPSAMLERIRSGLAGEMEPLRRFGSILSAVRVEQFAWANGIADSGKKLSDQQKILARYGLLLQDTAIQQGNFAQTSGGLANQSRILRAQIGDLSANLGGVLIPVLTDAAEAANLLFLALSKFRGVDFSPGFEFPDPPDWLRPLALAPVSGLAAGAVVTKRLLDDDKQTADITDQIGSSITGVLGKLEDALDKRQTAVRKILKKQEGDQRENFAAFVKGLGLKLDKTGLTDSLDDDIAVLRELERAILRQIEREGKTFKLVEQLINTRLAIASLVSQRAEDAAQKVRDAFNDTLDALGLKLDIAQTTKSFADDTVALNAIERTILKRIEQEGRTTELLKRLFDVRQQQADVRRQIAERAKAQRQSDQFKELGLTAEGEKRTPGSGSLLKRARSLQDQVKGTVLDTPKTQAQLAAIVRVLTDKFKNAGREVRQAILGMLNDISNALGSGDKKGPLTKTSGLNTKKILEDLGLTPEQANELRGRLSSFNTAGRAPGGSSTTGGVVGGFGGGQIVVESHTTINLDGQKIATAVTRSQQKAKKRNPQQKRGPNRIGGV